MKNQKGITLIALVITIIVLLILAGVTIAMLTGENGILTKAKTADTDTKNAEVAERINMELQAFKTDILANGSIQDATVEKAKANLPGSTINIDTVKDSNPATISYEGKTGSIYTKDIQAENGNVTHKAGEIEPATK